MKNLNMKKDFINLKVSIITPVYNSAKFIEETIESVQNQTYTNWEMIFVDDGSKDNSVEIIKNYQQGDERIRLYILDKNSGSGVARNKAILESKGEIIAFLDSDDIWVKEKLEKHVAFMVEKDAAFSHSSYGFIDEKGEIIKKTYHVSNVPVTYKKLLKRTEISCLTAMYDVRKTGKQYMPELMRKQDYGLWLSILKLGFNSIPLDQELAFYRQRRNSATSNKFKLILKHYYFLNKTQELSVFKSIYYTLYWGVNGIIKYY